MMLLQHFITPYATCVCVSSQDPDSFIQISISIISNLKLFNSVVNSTVSKGNEQCLKHFKVSLDIISANLKKQISS